MAKRRFAFGPRQSRQRDKELEDKIPGGQVTPELRRHADIGVEPIATDSMGFATVARQRVVDKFERLVASGMLNKAEAEAARLLRHYADSYWHGIAAPLQMKVDGGGRPGEAMVGRVHLAQRLQAALNYLNGELRRVAVAWILDIPSPTMGGTFLDIGRTIFPTTKDEERVRAAGRALCVVTCRELAVHFRMQSEYTFEVAKAPRPRMRARGAQEPYPGQADLRPTQD